MVVLVLVVVVVTATLLFALNVWMDFDGCLREILANSFFCRPAGLFVVVLSRSTVRMSNVLLTR